MSKKNNNEPVSSSIKNLADYYGKEDNSDKKKPVTKNTKGKAVSSESGNTQIVKLVVKTILAGIFSFAWLFMMLLIVSFVFVSSVHITIDRMLLLSAIFGIVIAIVYVVFGIRNMLKSKSK